MPKVGSGYGVAIMIASPAVQPSASTHTPCRGAEFDSRRRPKQRLTDDRGCGYCAPKCAINCQSLSVRMLNRRSYINAHGFGLDVHSAQTNGRGKAAEVGNFVDNQKETESVWDRTSLQRLR